jgi:hypothetical protein
MGVLAGTAALQAETPAHADVDAVIERELLAEAAA